MGHLGMMFSTAVVLAPESWLLVRTEAQKPFMTELQCFTLLGEG